MDLAEIPAWVPVAVAFPLALVLGALRVQASIYAPALFVLGAIASLVLLFVN